MKYLSVISPATICFLYLSAIGLQPAANAQQVMWGIGSPSPSSTNLESALSHATNGSSAGQVEAAKSGLMLGSNITVNAIGVQNILSVNGSDNNITSDQTSTNSGSVSNNGQIKK